MGEVTHEGVDSVTYQVTYLGEEYTPSEPGPEAEPAEGIGSLIHRTVTAPGFVGNVLSGLGVVTAVVLTVLLILSRREVRSLRTEDTENDEEQEDHGT